MSAGNINLWSKTISSNATADPTIAWPEGMLPSAVNDSSRAMMAAVADNRDDTCGALTTGGTSTAYTITTNSVNTAYQDGLSVGLVFHTATGTAPTLNVDAVGAKPIYKIGSSGPVALAANDYVQDAHLIVQYDASLNSAAGAWVCMTPLSAASAGGGATQTYFIGGSSTNSTNAYTLASLSGYSATTGYTLSFKPSAANTGASTLAITSPSISATNIFKSAVSGPIALTGGELQTNQTALLLYDGTRYILQNPSAGTASLLDTGTSANQVVKLNGSAQLPAVDGSLLTGIVAGTGNLVGFQKLTSSGTYTPTSGCTKAFAVIIGGGAGGGGTANINAAAGGGASGTITELYITSPTSTSITIGAAGGGGTQAGSATGTAGGTTSFGAITAPGGNGGVGGSTAGISRSGGASGGAGSGGSNDIPGQPGARSIGDGSTSGFLTGAGGSNAYGAGGQGVSTGAGNAGLGFGSGGSGGGGSGVGAGGTGTAGAILIWEYK